MLDPEASFNEIVRGPWNRFAIGALLTAVEGVADGPANPLCIIGPRQSGKSQLLSAAASQLFAADTPFSYIEINALGHASIAVSPEGPRQSAVLLIDDIDRASEPTQGILVQLIDLARGAGTQTIVSAIEIGGLIAPLRRRVSEGLVVPVELSPRAA